MADLEDSLKKLDRLTQEEARMAHAEVLRITHNIREGVKIVDSKVEEVGDKVQVVIGGARGQSSQFEITSDIYALRRQASKSSSEGYR
jgi:predicted GTPase